MDEDLKVDRMAAIESVADTVSGLMINIPIVWITLSICLYFDQGATVITAVQAVVLTIVALIRKYCVRVWFKKREEA
tara:strand:+ start:1985 stop:2215 length:231 start_codon:yes stop_codon:yes gene_type:complete